jgi:hypothetical protein
MQVRTGNSELHTARPRKWQRDEPGVDLAVEALADFTALQLEKPLQLLLPELVQPRLQIRVELRTRSESQE